MIKQTTSINGTCLQGYLMISYKELVDTLGEPQIKTYLGNDVTTEWRLEVDSVVITIYDWKEYRVRDEVPQWNIGGHSEKALDAVKRLFSENNVKTIREVHDAILPGYLYK